MVSAMSEPVLCCDLDGVIWLGSTPIRGSAAAIAVLRQAGRRIVFVTNNSSSTRADFATKLASVGIDATPDDVVSSATAAAEWCAVNVDLDEPILVFAGPGVVEALRSVGCMRLIEAGDASTSTRYSAVVCGWHRTFDFDRLAAATTALHRGARFVATNVDPTYPDVDRRLPGNGALVAALSTAAGRPPDIVCGKPSPPMAATVRRRVGEFGIMIGDRPSTDGDFAAALGWPFALVLSGVAGPGGEEPIPDPRPTWVAADLEDLASQLLR
jgi:HAD superfamily hydrolase (TIGR01450 family)